MAEFDTSHVKNIVLLGHAGSGKTTLAECMLFEAGIINRRGSIAERNTTGDYHELEQDRGNSIFSKLMHTKWRGYKINILDTPGYSDFVGEVISALRVADTGVMLINAAAGVEVGSDVIWQYTENFKTPMIFALNKLDLFAARERADAVVMRLGPDAIAVSAATGEAVSDLLKRIFAACGPREVVTVRAPGERRIVFAGGGRDWTVKKEQDGFRVHGDRVERLATGIDWESPDAAAYFQLLLQKNGVEKELRRLGVRSGDTVRIGGKELEWTEGGTR